MAETKKTENESSVVVQFNRSSGSSRPLFGSDIKHSHLITLTISKAYSYRDETIHSTHVMGTKTLAEVMMSQAQFAELITTMNYGVGTPGTLVRLGDKQIKPPIAVMGVVDQFTEETKAKIADLQNMLIASEITTKEILEKNYLTKADKDTLLRVLTDSARMVSDRLPFIVDQFAKAMDTIVADSKADVEAHINSAVAKAGLAGLKVDPSNRVGEDT